MTNHREREGLDGWWHTWLDEGADWRGEMPHLPGTPLHALPTHAPSVDWGNIEEGMESLEIPGTLAQTRPGYCGVVWQWRPLVVPDHWEGRAVRLRFGGARLRTEVYLENELVGYDLEGATPFEIDLTPHTRAGRRYELAVRVTHPGGRRAANESVPLIWGGRQLIPDDDYGGLFGGISLLGTPLAFIGDVYATSTPDGRGVVLRVELDNCGGDCCRAVWAIVRDGAGRAVGRADGGQVDLPGGQVTVVELPLVIADPRSWRPGDPHLYEATVTLEGDDWRDARRISFGLRDTAPEATAEMLRNLRAAATTNRYPGERPFCSARLAAGEMAAVRAMGFNALWADGQPFSEAVLAAADRAGVWLCQSLGRLAGLDAGDPFTAALARERVRRLVRRDRNHPSLALWHLDGDPTPVHGEAAFGVEALADLVARQDKSRPLLDPTGTAGNLALDRVAFDATGLEDIPRVARRYGDRVLPGSDAARYAAWQRALMGELASIGWADGADGLSRLCRGTWRAQQEALQALWATREDATIGCIVSHWNDDPVRGLHGLVDIWREPKTPR